MDLPTKHSTPSPTTDLSLLIKSLSSLNKEQISLVTGYVRSISSASTHTANFNRPVGMPADHRRKALSKREVEVLTLVSNGYSRREVAATLDISSNTAARHIANIYRKLNINTIAEATKYAIQSNLILQQATSLSADR